MTAQDLKNSILQLAVEGKLLKGGSLPLATAGKPSSATPSAGTPRNAPSDPKTGAELLEQIKAEKARLIAEGKIKKDTTKAGASGRALAEITEDEKPFDIPENWCWCRLGEIADIKSSKRVFEKDYVLKGIPFYRSKEIVDLENGDELRTPLYISEEHFEALKKNYGVPQPNDILIASIGATIGKSWIVDKRDFYYKDGNITQICSSDYFDSKYVYYFVKGSLFYMQVMGDVAGTAYNALTIIKLKNLLFPLPPLAEQKAIVAKIEELLPYIQKYDVAHTKLEEFNKKFPVDMQKSILQQAIMGKLTEDWRNEQARLAKTNSAVQLDDRSSAKDLLEKIKAQKTRLIAEGKIKKDTTKAGASGRALEPITEDEIPFDIPESWCWCRLGTVCWLDDAEKITGLYINLDAKYLRGKSDGEKLESGRLVKKYERIILVDGENSGEVFTVPHDGYMGSTFKRLCISNEIYEPYLNYFMLLRKEIFRNNKRGAAIPHLDKTLFRDMLFPLPPLAEQKAIVEKIEELLPLCKKLVK